jgi:hypothetical protein
MPAIRRKIRSLLWWATIRFGGRRLSEDEQAVSRLDFPTQVRGRGWRITEWLRDRLRPRWLRVTHADEQGD